MCISDINILEEYPRNIPTQSVFSPIDEVISERKIKKYKGLQTTRATEGN
jgi:hypothetical protein